MPTKPTQPESIEVPKPKQQETTMPTTPTTSEQSITTTPIDAFGRYLAWGNLAGKNAEAMMVAGQGTLEYMMACTEATNALYLDRVGKAQELAKTCINTRDQAHLVRVAAEYQRTLIEDYIGHARNVLGMTLDRATVTTNAIEERAQTALEEARQAA